MAKNLRWKVLTILGAVALSVFAFYPPGQKIRLGLDLKGGVHLVMRVQTDDALRLETETTADRLREATAHGQRRRRFGCRVGSGHSASRACRRPGRRVPPGPHRGGAVLRPPSAPAAATPSLKPNVVVQLREETVNQALQTIERRVNELGVAEPIVARHSEADQILVQLPGVTDVNRAKEIIRSTSLLELKQVEQGPFPDEASARQAYASNVPPDLQLLPGLSEGTPARCRPPSTTRCAACL